MLNCYKHTNEDTAVYSRISEVAVIIERAVCILRHLRSGEGWLANRKSIHSENLQAIYMQYYHTA